MKANNDVKVIHKPEERRFEVWENGSVSYVEYYLHDDALDISSSNPFKGHRARRRGGSTFLGALDTWPGLSERSELPGQTSNECRTLYAPLLRPYRQMRPPCMQGAFTF